MTRPTDSTAQLSARQAGSGVLWLTLAKFYFMITGMLLMLFLPGLFKQFAGDRHVEIYGDYRTVISLANWFNMVLIGGTLQAVSKFISEDETRAFRVKWTALGLQTIIGGLAALSLFLGADFIAERFYHHEALAPHLRLAAPIVLCYGYYAVIIGAMNGLRRFRHQAMMDMLFATLKVSLTIGLVAAGFEIGGAIGGFALTSVILLVVSFFVLGRQPAGEGIPWRTLWSFEWKTLLFAFFLNGLLQVDLQMLKAHAPAKLGDPSLQTGIYGAMQQIASIPYVATIAVAFVVFPLISKSAFEQDEARSRQYITNTNRAVLALLSGIVVTVALYAAPLIDLVYPEEYVAGAMQLSILVVGYLFFAGMVLNANILTASGHPSWSMALFGITLALSAGLNAWWVPIHGGLGSASATTAALAAGFLGTAALMLRRFRTFLPWKTPLRILVAAGVAWGLARVVLPSPATKGLTGLLASVGLAGMVFIAYLLTLALLRELNSEEWKRLAALVKRK